MYQKLPRWLVLVLTTLLLQACQSTITAKEDSWPVIRDQILTTYSCPLFPPKEPGEPPYIYISFTGSLNKKTFVALLCNTGQSGTDNAAWRYGTSKACPNGHVVVEARNGTFSEAYTGAWDKALQGRLSKMNFADAEQRNGATLLMAYVVLSCVNDGPSPVPLPPPLPEESVVPPAESNI